MLNYIKKIFKKETILSYSDIKMLETGEKVDYTIDVFEYDNLKGTVKITFKKNTDNIKYIDHKESFVITMEEAIRKGIIDLTPLKPIAKILFSHIKD